MAGLRSAPAPTPVRAQISALVPELTIRGVVYAEELGCLALEVLRLSVFPVPKKLLTSEHLCEGSISSSPTMLGPETPEGKAESITGRPPSMASLPEVCMENLHPRATQAPR